MLMILRKKTIIRERSAWGSSRNRALFPEPAVKQLYGKFAHLETQPR